MCRTNGQRLPKGRSESELSGNTSGVDSGVASMKDTCSPASGSCASTTEMKGRKKMPMKTAWNINTNTLQKNNELEQNHPFGARSSTFLLICISTINMIHTKNLAFSHNMSKTCDDADIEYRKQYSAPAGALTMYTPPSYGMGG